MICLLNVFLKLFLFMSFQQHSESLVFKPSPLEHLNVPDSKDFYRKETLYRILTRFLKHYNQNEGEMTAQILLSHCIVAVYYIFSCWSRRKTFL